MSVVINGSSSVVTNSGAVYDGIQRGTAVTASGTSVDFTGIPSWVKRITVMLNDVSTSGTSNYLIQLGDAGGVENTGYISSANYSTSSSAASTAGFFIVYGIAAASTSIRGCLILCNLSGNTWVGNGNFTDDNQRNSSSAGGKVLSDVLTTVRITTVNGTDTFDAGSINILYE